MRRIHISVACFLSLGIFLGVRDRTKAQIAATKSSDHLDAVDLQRKAESALDRIQQDDVGQGTVDATYYIELAAHVEPRRAIPVLEAYFARSHEADLRSEIASVLVSLKDEDPQFWNLILNEAKTALSEDPPDPFEMGQAGPSLAPCSSQAFLKWAKNRKLSLDKACQEASFGIPRRVRPLADSGDRRGVPLLQTALEARNPLIRALAAQGLVLTGDRDAITIVIETIEHAPKDRAREMAESLLESDDPRAESVVHRYMPDVNFREAHQFRTQREQLLRPILTGK